MNLIQNHNESRDEDMVNVREHGDVEGVLSQQHLGDSVLTAYLQHECKLTAKYLQTCTKLNMHAWLQTTVRNQISFVLT